MRFARRKFFFLILPVLSLCLGVWTVQAQGGPTGAELDRQVREVTSRLNCPLCQGQTLNECPLQICDEMRELIRQKLQAGESDDQIIAYFVQRFGDRVLNEPPRSGFALLGWVMPVLGLLLGIALVTLALRAMTRRTPRPAPVAATPNGAAGSRPPAPAGLPQEYVDRLERELKQME